MRPIKNFEGIYSITKNGRIWSAPSRYHKNGKGKWLKPSLSKRGYQTVTLCKAGKLHYKRLARLVAETYVSNPNNHPQVNHVNAIRTDDRAQNLEWVTAKQNIDHAVKLGSRVNKLNAVTANRIRKLYKKGVRGRGLETLASEFGVTNAAILRVLRNEIHKPNQV